MRFTKYEIFPTRIPMVDRVRDAWIAGYKLQGIFQTHYSPVFVRLYTDDGLVGTAESLAGVPQTESIVKRIGWKIAGRILTGRLDSSRPDGRSRHFGPGIWSARLPASVFHPEIRHRTYLVDALSAAGRLRDINAELNPPT